MIELLLGDSLKVLDAIPSDSVDAIVTDPPYEIAMMGKKWDATGIAYNVDLWAECLRVLRPGGHLLSFGATRTYHRMACAVEDAGFEIRDSIAWVQSQGMPKSMNAAKAFAKAGQGDLADTWEGWGTALKPTNEPIVVARKPFTGRLIDNLATHHTGAINIDGCRVSTNDSFGGGAHGSSGFAQGYEANSGWVAGPAGGRWPTNTILGHTPHCRQVGTVDEDITINTFDNGAKPFGDAVGEPYTSTTNTTTTAIYECADNCPIALINEQSGEVGAAAPASGPTYSGHHKSGSMAGAFKGMGDQPAVFHADTGGAARMYPNMEWGNLDLPPILYSAKAKKSERPHVDGVASHPTQKPLKLMRWLIRLVTPNGGVILDPFAGSGTTLEAALLEGKNAIGIELLTEHAPLINERITRHNQELLIVDATDL